VLSTVVEHPEASSISAKPAVTASAVIFFLVP
jgi:hypothetical protein